MTHFNTCRHPIWPRLLLVARRSGALQVFQRIAVLTCLVIGLHGICIGCGLEDVVGTVAPPADAENSADDYSGDLPSAGEAGQRANDDEANDPLAGAKATADAANGADAAKETDEETAKEEDEKADDQPSEGPAAPESSPPAASLATVACTAAASAFDQALCACKELSVMGNLQTSAGEVADTKAHVRVSGTLRLSGFMGPVAGDVSAIGSGETLISSAANARIEGGLQTTTSLGLAGSLTVARDAWLQTPPLGAGTLNIAGNLYTPQKLPADATGVTVSGDNLVGPFSLPDPCNCDPMRRLPIAKWIDAHRADSATGEALRAQLSAIQGAVVLPAGTVFLQELVASEDVELSVDQPTSLFIAGDLTVPGTLSASIGRDADLAIFVGGTLTVEGELALGSPATSIGRLYIAGDMQSSAKASGAMGNGPRGRATVGSAAWNVHLYAPQVDLTFSGSSMLNGSLYVNSLSALGGVTVEHDSNVTERGEVCRE